jgi:hypothetical protein
MAGGVVANAFSKHCADVLNFKSLHEKLAQFENVCEAELLSDGGHTRRRRRNHCLETAKHTLESAGESMRLGPVTAVEVHLPTARLLTREYNLVPKPLEQLNGRLPDRREHCVHEAGREEGDFHALTVTMA